MQSEGPREACGVFGVFAPGEDVARLTFYGLYALQHRGQESAGIATGDGQRIHLRTGMGLIAQVFDEADLSYLPGQVAVGHTRYSTTGSNRVENAQPVYVEGPRGPLALGHNGNLVNAAVLRRDLEQQGYLFKTSTDTEIIAQMLATAPGTTWERRIGHVMQRIQGAYSPRGSDAAGPVRHARPLRHPSALPGLAERRLGRGLRDVRPRPPGRQVRAGGGAGRGACSSTRPA